MKKLIDANVILRYLLGDHPQMSEEVGKVIEDGAFTLTEVIAEVTVVFGSCVSSGNQCIFVIIHSFSRTAKAPQSNAGFLPF